MIAGLYTETWSLTTLCWKKKHSLDVKVCDFGLARTMPETVNKNLNSIKSRNLLNDTTKNEASDVWNNQRSYQKNLSEALINERS